MPLNLGRHLQIGGFVIITSLIIPTAEKPMQGLSAASPMQVCSFHANQPLVNQSLIIRNMDDGSVLCMVNFTTVPYSVNCTQPGTSVSVKTESDVKLLSTNMTKNLILEYGSGRNGQSQQATCEDIPENTGREEESEGSKSADSTPQPSLDDGRNDTVGIILGVLAAAAVVALCISYISCERFRRWVNAAFCRLRGCKMRSFNKTGTTSNANARSSPNEGDVSVPLAPIERGQ